MSDVRISDFPPIMGSSSFMTGKPVRAISAIGFSELTNWLNFYARRHLPYTRVNGNGMWRWSSPFPMDGNAFDSPRYLTVVVGIRLRSFSVTAGVKVTTSTDTTGETVSVGYAGAIGPSISAYQTEAVVSYFAIRVEAAASGVELVKVESSAGESLHIDGVGIWELPPGDYVSTTGGCPPHHARFDSTKNTIVDTSDFWPGKDIVVSPDGVEEILDASNTAFNDHGKVLFTAGGSSNADGMIWHTNSVYGSWVRLPLGGIYIPPRIGHSSQDYTNCNIVLRGTNAVAGTKFRFYSEELAWTSDNTVVTASTGTLWQPGDRADDVTTWNNSSAGYTSIRADIEGDWLFIDIYQAADTEIFEIHQIIIWDEGV